MPKEITNEGLFACFKKGQRNGNWRKLNLKKAAKLLEEGEEKGAFVWAPRLRHWLKDPDYIFWLGTV